MNHVSFYWLPHNRELLLEALEHEFAHSVEQSLSTGKIILPPIPKVVLDIQKMCTDESTSVFDVAECLLDDPSLTATVLRIANSVIFNRRNITFNDITTAVSRLGIHRVRDIVTAQSIEQLKYQVNLRPECNKLLADSAVNARELGATMVMVVKEFKKVSPETYAYLEQDKALLVGLLADIGLFCLISEYHLYLENGNYLKYELALQLFEKCCAKTSFQVLKLWGFDKDFLTVCANKETRVKAHEVSYLDIAKIAFHLLLFRKQSVEIENHQVEINADGAEVLFELSNLSENDFEHQVSEIVSATGF